MTHAQLVTRLLALVKRAGSQQDAAQRIGVSAAYLSDVLAGKRHAGPKILKHFGIAKTLRYEKART